MFGRVMANTNKSEEVNVDFCGFSLGKYSYREAIII